jgi:hypothetical protein
MDKEETPTLESKFELVGTAFDEDGYDTDCQDGTQQSKVDVNSPIIIETVEDEEDYFF